MRDTRPPSVPAEYFAIQGMPEFCRFWHPKNSFRCWRGLRDNSGFIIKSAFRKTHQKASEVIFARHSRAWEVSRKF
jgi:hypothetical protein